MNLEKENIKHVAGSNFYVNKKNPKTFLIGYHLTQMNGNILS